MRIEAPMPDLTKEEIMATVRPFDPLTKFDKYNQKYPEAMKLLSIGGVHPIEESPEMVNPYLTEKVQGGDWRNVGEHCLATGYFFDQIGSRLVERGVMGEGEFKSGMIKDLTHDATKRWEIMRRDAAKAGVSMDAYGEAGYATVAGILKANGIAEDIVMMLKNAGAETGHNSLKDFLDVENGQLELKPNMLVEKIIHLADDMTATTIPEKGQRAETFYATPWERMVLSDFPTRYPWMWQEGLALDRQSRLIVPVKDHQSTANGMEPIGHYAQLQVFVGNRIANEIKNTLQLNPNLRGEVAVKELVSS